MIKVPMTLIVSCDECQETKMFNGVYPYGISELDLLKFYIFDDWRDSGNWIVTDTGKVFCGQSCKEVYEDAR